MLTISNISAAFADTAGDQNTVYVIVGILVFLLLASAGAAGRTRVKKYCPYCRRKINYSPSLIRPEKKYSLPSQGRVHNRAFQVNRPKIKIPHENAPVVRKGGKMYCPYCRGQL